MKTVVKALMWLTGSLILLAVGIVLFVTLAIDPNDYKQEISTLVE